MKNPILAIETATSRCSVALGDGAVVIVREQDGSNIHSQVLLQMVEDVLQEANVTVRALSAVAVGQGPGSFTGLRIGIGVAQGLAYGAACPMIGVSSLAALARQAYLADSNVERVFAGIDARMNELYCAQYQIVNGWPKLDGELMVIPPEDALDDNEASALAGNAWQVYWERLATSIQQQGLPQDAATLPSAAAIEELGRKKYRLGEVTDPRAFKPEYVRNNVAKKSSQQSNSRPN